MLVVVNSMRELRFGELMAVYEQSNLENGRRQWPSETAQRQLALAEQDFYDYLRNCFFKAPGAACCLWQEHGRYACALRLEMWKDGLLLTGLETAPDQRGKGYARSLIWAVEDYLAQRGAVRLYSHVNKRNAPSIVVHERCGFRKTSDYAAYLDGSVDKNSVTYIYEV